MYALVKNEPGDVIPDKVLVQLPYIIKYKTEYLMILGLEFEHNIVYLN